MFDLVCVLFRADAYQSIIMLMGRQQLYAHWHNQAKVNHMEWTEDEAAQVLEAWKREFTKVRRMIMITIAMTGNCAYSTNGTFSI